jgi:hypothetical protein
MELVDITLDLFAREETKDTGFPLDSHGYCRRFHPSSTASTACFCITQILPSYTMCLNVVCVLIILPILTRLAAKFMKGRGNGEFWPVARSRAQTQGSGFSLLPIFVHDPLAKVVLM